MNRICENCGSENNLEENTSILFTNGYGSRCLHCGRLINPIDRNKYVKSIKENKEKLQKEFLSKFRKNIYGDKK